ncbi:MAG: YkgJ family cysteine cluster protein [Caldilineales bacterium]|nr:YkgJ family cysteine cluster protein [Caldilineales bacterium]
MNDPLPLFVADPDQVAARGQALAPQQWAWYDQVQPLAAAGDPDLIAALTTTLATVSAAIDCTTCGRCCRQMGPQVEAAEAAALAAALGLQPELFRRGFLRPLWPAAAEDEQVWLLPSPCPLHDGLLCTVYAARPRPCRDFPQAAGQTPAAHLGQLVEFARICPIAFNTVEQVRQRVKGPA